MAKQGFFKVYFPNSIRTITKEFDGTQDASTLKKCILSDLCDAGHIENASDFSLINLTSGNRDLNNSNDNDVFIMIKNNCAESSIFSHTSDCTIGCSFHDLRMLPKDIIYEKFYLDGETLDFEKLIDIGHRKYIILLSDAAKERIIKSRAVIDSIINDGKEVVYGVNTGFGKFKDKVIAQEKCKELQVNLITSHACGVGRALSLMQTRMVIALRINVLAKGCSGIRLLTVERMLDALNSDCLPYIPEKGSVGASGDLAPLSHLVIGLMGYGDMWSPRTGWGKASEVLKFNGLQTIELEAKEGLALNNGTQVITAVGAEALFRANMIAKQADIVAALTAEVLEGVPEQFHADVHEVRPHPGQQLTAARLRQLMSDSEGKSSSIIQARVERDDIKGQKKNQDAYSIRCTPQVHGIVHETIAFVKSVLNTEINSATDNPLVILKRSKNLVASAGNFHGEYPGMALDQLAIAIQEIANISERRIERLVHPDYLKGIANDDGLPGFLVGAEEGLNNGFMILQYTAAALVSENKVLTHPSTVDSITTSGGSEDHVSMGTYAARKAVTIVENVENVLAIELLAACQALDLHRKLNPIAKTTKPLENIHKLVRQHANEVKQDHYMAPDIAAVVRLLQEGKIWNEVKKDLTDNCWRDGLQITFT